MNSSRHHPPALRLSPPRPTRFQLQRTQVDHYVESASGVRLIVLRAPAGFGKTTAMLQHAARREAAGAVTGWLTLDASDNDIGRFLRNLEQAMAPVAPHGGEPQEEGDVPDVLDVLERIGSSTASFTLFLDDFETIQSSSVLDMTRQIVECLPETWQLVIGSRIAPGIGLGRLRARGQLLEIGLAQLRFSLEETATFLRARRGLAVGDAALARLHEVTEGWATALWLASLAMERHADPEAFLDTFSGSDSAIADFLAEDVLARLPEAQRDFLLRTSVLRELDVQLCDAVLERNDSRELLAQLGHANLFLVELGQPGQYRYHSLFAEFLRAQLAQRDPKAGAALHRRASLWYEANGREVPAVEHALLADDFDRSADLLRVHAQRLLDGGRFRLLGRWLDKLPQPLLERHRKLRIVRAWVLICTHRYPEAVALVEQLHAQMQADPANWDDESRAHMLAQRPVIMMMLDKRDGWSIGIANHERLDPRHAFPYGVLTNTLAIVHAGMDHDDEARALLDRARRASLEVGIPFNVVVGEVLEGTISLKQGRLQEAIARLRIAMHNLSRDRSRGAAANAPAAVVYAEALYEAGELEQAGHILTVYLPLARELWQADQAVRGYLTLSRIAWQRGEADRAYGLLSELEYAGHQDGIARLVVIAELERSRLALVRGDVAAATAYLRRAADDRLWRQEDAVPIQVHETETMEIARLRLCVHGTQAAQESDMLAQALERLPDAILSERACRNHRLALRMTLLLVHALHRAGQRDAARERIAQSLATACTEGIVQPFADEGPTIAALALAWARRALASGRMPPGALPGYVERLEAACALAAGDADMDADAPDARAGGRGEALTHREIQVVKLLALGKSNAELAETMFVSENTVRTHLRNIFSKLGTRNRTETVANARRHGLID